MDRLLTGILTVLIMLAPAGCTEEQAAEPDTPPAVQGDAQSHDDTQAATPEPSPAPRKPGIPPASADPKVADVMKRWQPDFDPSGAEHTYVLSCIGHPDIAGVAVGFNIRDEVWKRTGGRLYVDFRPLGQLGGERDVLTKLRMGAIQGMLSSSVAAANLDNRLGVVNLPFLIDTREKLEKFRNDPELFGAYGASLRSRGILVADFTGYGAYGWASRRPAKTVVEAQTINFRIAQAPVNTELYKAWGMKFTVMPWPDVPQALQTGVIDGLDHTPIVCSISRKFDTVKNFTFVNYAQGLYIHLIDLKWLNNLPGDLRQILLEVIREESAESRQATWEQEEREIEKAKSQGVRFWELAEGERQRLEEMARPIYARWEPRIGSGYVRKVRQAMSLQ